MQKRINNILAELVGFATVSSESNLELIDYIHAMLKPFASGLEIIPNNEGNKASILASFGPLDRPGIVLSGHTDVVPVTGQQWLSDPFQAFFSNGRIYGRGTTDMKGFIAVALAHAEQFSSKSTSMPVHLAFSYDEELGCKGAPDLVARVASLAAGQKLCIVGEPTDMRVICGHKGKTARQILVHGHGGHSSMPHKGANAAVAAAKIVVGLDEISQTLQNRQSDSPFEPPWSTLHVGTLHSGTALNLIPDHASIEFEIRSVPESPAEDVEHLIAQVLDSLGKGQKHEQLGVDVKVNTLAAYPGLSMPADHEAVGLAMDLAGSSFAPAYVSFGSEAGLFQQAGIPTVVCGPGDISRAHKANEWVGLNELAQASQMMNRIAALAAA